MAVLLTKNVIIKWNAKTKNYYVKRGYNFTKLKDNFIVKIKDLTYGSKAKVSIKCDYCGEVYETLYCDYYRSHKYVAKDACKNCRNLKAQEVILQKYGVSNIFQLQEIQNKAKQTIFDRYGVSNVSQSNEIQEKIKQNNLEKYGVKSTSQLDITKQKAKETSLMRYGVEYPMQTIEFQKKFEVASYKKYGVRRPTQNKEIRNKVKHTDFIRYGVEFPTQNKDILAKSIRSRYLHGNHTCSKQQYELYQAIGGKLNYPFNNFIIDVAFPEKKIAVEWNGSGHNLSVRLNKISQREFDRNENFRRKILFENEWKIITFVTKKDIFPDSINIIMKYCINGGHSIYILIDSNEIVFKNIHININEIESL